MAYTLLALLVVLVALPPLWLAGRLLLRRGWLLRWLQGSVGLLLIGLAAGIALVAMDLHGYRATSVGKPLLTIAVQRIDTQHYRLLLLDDRGEEQILEVRGDLWQMDVRLLLPGTLLQRAGLGTGYRLERLGARYLSLEQELAVGPREQTLLPDGRLPDVWRWMHRYEPVPAVLRATRARISQQPLADGALFGLFSAGDGLLVTPLNERAQRALQPPAAPAGPSRTGTGPGD